MIRKPCPVVLQEKVRCIMVRCWGLNVAVQSQVSCSSMEERAHQVAATTELEASLEAFSLPLSDCFLSSSA